MGTSSNAHLVYGLSYSIEISYSSDTEDETETLVLASGRRIEVVEIPGDWESRYWVLDKRLGRRDCEDLSGGWQAERGAFGFVRSLDVWDVPAVDFTIPEGADELFAAILPDEKPEWHFVHSRS